MGDERTLRVEPPMAGGGQARQNGSGHGGNRELEAIGGRGGHKSFGLMLRLPYYKEENGARTTFIISVQQKNAT
jgi:hypothetical protein